MALDCWAECAVMTPTLIAALLIASPEYHGARAHAQVLAVEIERAERRHHLPALLLASVVLAESGGRNVVSAVRRCGGRDVGPAQVHTHERERLQRLLVLSVNLDEGARILVRSRDLCRRRQLAYCRRSHWAGYNARSLTWWGRVAAIWGRLRGERQSNV